MKARIGSLLLLFWSVCLRVAQAWTLKRLVVPNRLLRRTTASSTASRVQPAPEFSDFPKRRFLGVMPHIASDPVATIQAHYDYCREHALPGIEMDIGILGRMTCLVDSAAIQAVMEDRSNVMYRSALDRRAVGLLTGQGVLLTDGPDHTRKRRLIMPTLGDSFSLNSFVEIMNDAAKDSVESLRSDNNAKSVSFDVMDTMSSMAMRIVSACLFSTDVTEDSTATGDNQSASAVLMHEITDCLDHVIYVSRHPFAAPLWVPTRRNRQFRKSRRRLDDLVQRLIDHGRARTEESSDLLSMLLQARFEDDSAKGLTDKELRDEVMTLFLAGHETTAVALSWTFWFLSAPEMRSYQELIAAEADQVEKLGGYTPKILQDPEVLKHTRAALCEALRLRGPSWAVDRQVQKATVLPGDIAVRKGELLLIAPLMIQTDEQYFVDAGEFQPDRFLTKGPNDRGDIWDGPFSRSVYMPFGAGRKRCVGYKLAQWEMLVIVSTFMKAFRVRQDASAADELEMVPGITLRPQEGFELTLDGC